MASAPTPKPIRLPAAIRQGGQRGWIMALVLGAVLGAITLIIPALLAARDAFGFLAIWLGAIAAVYLGFALSDGRQAALAIEWVGLVLFMALATVALVRESAWLLAAGYLGHGLWDAVHHRRGIDTAMPWWYVPACLGYDAVVAIYVLIRF